MDVVEVRIRSAAVGSGSIAGLGGTTRPGALPGGRAGDYVSPPPPPPPPALVPTLVCHDPDFTDSVNMTFAVPVHIEAMPVSAIRVSGAAFISCSLIAVNRIRWKNGNDLAAAGTFRIGANDPAVRGVNGAFVAAGDYPYVDCV